MKINSVSCTQFAGLLSRSVDFSDGLNVIIGANESGKSTVASLISEVLFRSARLDGRSDKDFIESSFPAKKRGGRSGDFADGKITFTCDGAAYTLSKEWSSKSAESRCILTTPDGVIRDGAQIEEILRELLCYGKGVYVDMLLNSRRISADSLASLLDRKSKDKSTELTEAVTAAFSEADGVSLDSIERAIDEKIEAIAGQHWDIARREPMRSTSGKRWEKGRGEILTLRYDLEDKRRSLLEMQGLEAAVDTAAERCNEYKAILDKAEAEKAELEANIKLILGRASAIKLADSHKRAVSEYERVLSEWPRAEKELEKGRRLLEERKKVEILERYSRATEYAEAVRKAAERLADLSEPSEAEIKAVKTAASEIAALERSLGGMNIAARLKKLSESTEIIVTTVRNGERVDASDGSANITEAVKIEIPGVVEMILTPADTDIDTVNERISALALSRNAILERYGASDEEQLASMRAEYTRARNDYMMAKSSADMFMNGESLEELSEKAKNAEGTRTGAEIAADIMMLCNGAELSRFVIERDTVCKRFAEGYGTQSELTLLAATERAELSSALEAIEKSSDIPEGLLSITDPERYLADKTAEIEACASTFRRLSEEKTAAQVSLERYAADFLGGKSAGDLSDEVSEAQARYDEALELLDHWINIKRVFDEKRSELTGNPIRDLAVYFEENLSYVSCGGVKSDLGESDRLDMTILKNDTELDYIKLSDGTREAVSIAFRLAVLEHLFPDGGGTAVFDDPFVNMDSDRCKRACDLLVRASARHQIIFLTCREEYCELLGGKEIRFN